MYVGDIIGGDILGGVKVSCRGGWGSPELWVCVRERLPWSEG